MGSQLKASFEPSTKGKLFYCDDVESDDLLLWFKLSAFRPKIIDCWAEIMRLHYDNVQRNSYDTPGSKIDVNDFGKIQPIEHFSSTLASFGLGTYNF